MKREAQASRDGIAEAHAEHAFQQLSAFIPEHDAENVVVDDFLDPLRNLAQQFLAVEDGGDFAAYLVKQREGAGLLGIGDEQTRGDGVGVADQRKCGQFGLFIHIRSIRLVPEPISIGCGKRRLVT